MTIGQSMLPEFDQEMQNTRRMLERVPEKNWNWKPHDKSGTVGWLAGHVATMISWLPTTLTTHELDYAPVGGPARRRSTTAKNCSPNLTRTSKKPAPRLPASATPKS